jgi:hypothetical protein
MNATTKKTYNSRVVFWILAALMALTAIYMTIVIKKVPRSVESSKIGPFPALVEKFVDFHKNPPAPGHDGKTWDKEAVNAVMKQLTPYEGLAMKRAAVKYELLNVNQATLDERPLLMMRLKHPEGAQFSLAMFPIAKRHFPKTRSFVHKDAWFFQYGKDLEGSPVALQTEIPPLKGQNENLIATNYGNDYYLLLIGESSAKDLARWLFESTTVFSPKK